MARLQRLPTVSVWLVAMSLCVMSLCVSSSGAEKSGAETVKPLKGLIITGGCCHDYPNQKRILAEGLSQRANIAWDVVHEGGTSSTHKVALYGKPNWAQGYDVIVHNECFGKVTDPDFVSEITRAHHQGVPGVFIHCALHSYREAGSGADAWRELIGVTSVRHQQHGSVLVRTMNADHPIMQGFPKQWQTPNGELYEILQVWPNCIPLGQAYGSRTDSDHVCIWANTFGKARVFGTSLGHHNETMNNDVWLGLVARGVLWTCGKLQENGEPLPGYEGSGIKPIVLDNTLEPKPDPKGGPRKRINVLIKAKD